MHAQRGFTLVEVLVATGIAAMLAIASIAIAHAFVGLSTRASSIADAETRLDRLDERLDAETAGAWSVFVPANDVFGIANADGHELDVATEDALRRPSFRAYRYDANAATLTEYVYGAPGASGLATGDVTAGITRFAATNGTASAMAGPLYANARIVDADVALGLGAPGAVGGNRLTRVVVRLGAFERTITLASATAPSSYTVVLRYTPAP